VDSWSPAGAAIAGIGATEFSRQSGRSELRLALEAILAALDDAGLAAAEVDGLCTYTMDSTPPIDIARNLGLRQVSFFSRSEFGGGAACAVVQQAALAVTAGIARVVVCYRALNDRSGTRLGTGDRQLAADPTAEAIRESWYLPHGLSTPAARAALIARRYMHEFGVTSEDFGRVTVAARKYAATNPRAWFYRKPLTLAEHQASRIIADPLHLYDCCQESDGAVALVVTRAAHAADLAQPPAIIKAAAQGMSAGQEMLTGYYGETITGLPELAVAAEQLWHQSGLSIRDVQAAVLYDHFTPLVLMQLEELGVCARGSAAEFVRSGALDQDGTLPVNPHGGQLGEAYIHGLNGVAEAVRQVRGQSVNQIGHLDNVIVTAGTGIPTSALLVGRS
jgi:acetyl-CoA acetyltransferase